ncbi:MAG: hypothetical protein AAGA53_07600 [Pseudomonadota bacterium]
MSKDQNRQAIYSVSQSHRASAAVEKARVANKTWAERRREMRKAGHRKQDTWKRETRILPRAQAREYARQFLKKYPKAAYWSEVESWRVLEGDVIEFTMRRLPSAD